MTHIRPLALVPLIALLGACATSGEYPSLAQRPAERATGSFTPDAPEVQPTAPSPPSADLVQRLASLQRDAETAHAEFTRATPAAERLAAASGAAPSDSWAAAQVALADLDSLRSRASIPLAELDTLWADASIADSPRSEIAQVRARVESLIAAEDAVLARLRARVR